jgi:NTP pyrophosphatase (non-canonical NTP hydrolase)
MLNCTSEGLSVTDGSVIVSPVFPANSQLRLVEFKLFSIPTRKESNNMKEFNQYQEFVKGMKVYPEQHKIIYPTLGLTGEAGEIAEKVKKYLRGDKELDREGLLKEMGDPLWYLTSLADDLGFTLQDVVDANVEKLTSRKERGVLKGSGDDR